MKDKIVHQRYDTRKSYTANNSTLDGSVVDISNHNSCIAVQPRIVLVAIATALVQLNVIVHSNLRLDVNYLHTFAWTALMTENKIKTDRRKNTCYASVVTVKYSGKRSLFEQTSWWINNHWHDCEDDYTTANRIQWTGQKLTIQVKGVTTKLRTTEHLPHT